VLSIRRCPISARPGVPADATDGGALTVRSTPGSFSSGGAPVSMPPASTDSDKAIVCHT